MIRSPADCETLDNRTSWRNLKFVLVRQYAAVSCTRFFS